MRHHLPWALCALAVATTTTTTTTAQDLIHYKFESNCRNEVINHAVGSPIGPGTIETGGTLPAGFSSWTAGAFGGGLTGGAPAAPTYYNRVRTGWINPNLTGDLTIAWFMKQRSTFTSTSYISSLVGSHRIFTGGVASRGLMFRNTVASGGNSGARDVQWSTVDVQTAAASTWAHIALVVNSATNTADLYLNGVPQTTLTIGTGGALINETAAGEYTVGIHTGTTAFAYDIDEFLISNRAYTAAEITAMVAAPRAGAGRFHGGVAQCGSSSLTAINGAPSLGNLNHALQITSSIPLSWWSLMVGTNSCALGGVTPLPLDAGLLSPLAAGCKLLVDPNIGSLGGIGTGTVVQPFPVPPVPGFAGMNLFCQAALIDLATLAVEATNGWGIATGN